MFFGIEKDLFILDLLVFLLVDHLAKNFILAASVLYIIDKILSVIRSDLGKRNLTKKTSIDQRFLL